jgi:hypothetical protein|tara:strand:- start:8 stop:301 length:294 start_codon:yes stop_codon:yes gene_type:complete
MAITKSTEIAKVEVVQKWVIQVATDIVIKEDNVEISRSRHRTSIVPFSSLVDADGVWTHTATDISNEEASVQAVANSIWTDAVKNNYKVWAEAQGII